MNHFRRALILYSTGVLGGVVLTLYGMPLVARIAGYPVRPIDQWARFCSFVLVVIVLATLSAMNWRQRRERRELAAREARFVERYVTDDETADIGEPP